MIRVHSLLLIMCSIISFIGHYEEFHVFRITAWIPASAGLLILLCYQFVKNKESLVKHVPLIFTLAFGILTTVMCIRFLPQTFQPIRKKIVFSLMSLSAWLTISSYIKTWIKAKA